MDRKGHASDLAHGLGDRVGDGENLIAVFIQQQMIVAEVRTRNMPMDVLRFEVEGKHFCQRNIESAGYFPDILGLQIRRSLQVRCLQPLIPRLSKRDSDGDSRMGVCLI